MKIVKFLLFFIPVLAVLNLSPDRIWGDTPPAQSSFTFWNAPFGTDYETCLRIWTAQGKFPDLKIDGPVFNRDARENLIFFRYQPFLGLIARNIQVVFRQGVLSKVSLAYHQGNDPSSYFQSFYTELKRYFDKTYFPSNKTLGFLKTGAAWLFPGGESIYMGFVDSSDLVVILEGSAGAVPKPSGQLYPQQG